MRPAALLVLLAAAPAGAQTAACVSRLADAGFVSEPGFGRLDADRFLLLDDAGRLHLYAKGSAGSARVGTTAALRVKAAGGWYYLAAADGRLNLPPLLVPGPALATYAQVKARAPAAGPVTVTSWSGEPAPATRFTDLPALAPDTPARTAALLVPLVSRALAAAQEGPFPSRDSYALRATLAACAGAARELGSATLARDARARLKTVGAVLRGFKSVRLTVTVDGLEARIRLENDSDAPVTYYSWSCPGNGNYASLSGCVTLDPGNLACLQNVPGPMTLAKGRPVERMIALHVSKACAPKPGGTLPLEVGFYEDGGFEARASPPIATSAEATVTVPR